ncbi:unnamed protein product [Angiostrongylus costaricensis]|uniref:SHSP domain-containing protein n=1 Tax=Angiostrongylus costaricensis TaxID=334426 RepID=A0A0R3PD50_ANGCS|nr:unnamed protein product [Angiostrongylus costaricensis]
MSLWIRPANVFFPRFVDECLSDFCHMERRMRQMERMMLDPVCRTIRTEVLDKSVSEIVDNDSKFAVSIDVSKFKPEHLKVNIDGRCLTIEGKEELEEENSYSMRAFTRQFVLPEDVNLDAIRSSLTNSGKLSVEVPKVTKTLESGGRAIPIEQVPQKPIFPRFIEECMRDFRQMDRMMFSPLYRALPSEIIDRTASEPENLKVNVIGHRLTIEGKEELKEENGYSLRSFTRQFILPEDVNMDAIRSSLTDKGQLSVEVPKLEKPSESGGRSIPIENVGEKA